MTGRIRARIEQIELRIGQAAVGPDQVRMALHRLLDHGELPSNDALRRVVVKIRDALNEMDRRTCGSDGQIG